MYLFKSADCRPRVSIGGLYYGDRQTFDYFVEFSKQVQGDHYQRQISTRTEPEGHVDR
jgi:hypothetical protein